MTITTETAVCPACGAPNLGTRFCESCGTQLVQESVSAGLSALPAAVPVPAAAADPAIGYRVIALLLYLTGIIVSTSIFLAQFSNGGIPASAWAWADTIASWAVALFLIIAAAVGRATPGAKSAGILFGVAYAIAIPIFDFAPWADAQRIEQIVGPVLLFGAWAGGRGFRAGWAAVVAVVILGFLGWNVAPVLSPSYTMLEVMRGGFLAIGLAIVILLANGFDGPKPGTRRVNGAARASMVLLLSTFVLNSLAGNFSGGISIFMLVVVVLLLVSAIIFGHVGFVRAGRRGERGRPLAAWTLALSYLIVILEVILVGYLISVLVALRSLY